MQLVCLSDTHGYHNDIDVPDGDILVHCGDAELDDTNIRYKSFLKWFKAQPHKHKVFVPGNHDWVFYHHQFNCQLEFETNGIITLIDQAREIDGIKFYGSPYSPEFCGWAFMYPRFEMYNKVWYKVPEDTQVLLTHSPAYGMLDNLDPSQLRHNYEEPRAGCKGLEKRIGELKKLELHVTGHLHYGYGAQLSCGSLNGKIPTLTTVNASICTDHYHPTNKPIVVNI